MPSGIEVTSERESTQVIPSSEGAGSVRAPERDDEDATPEKIERKSFRTALRANFRGEKSDKKPVTPSSADSTDGGQDSTGTPSPGAPAAPSPIAAPSDMNAEERAAFANPTAENAHIIQGFVSRRAYETRTDYQRQTQTLQNREKEVSGILEVVAPVRDTYARKGISPQDIVRRSIAWDNAFAADPIAAAREYLAAYGVDPAALIGGQNGQQQQQRPAANYLTREEAQALANDAAKNAVTSHLETERQRTVAETNVTLVNSFIAKQPLFRDPGTAAQLEPLMAPVIANLRATQPQLQGEALLQSALDFVTKTHPTFSGLIAQMNAKSEVDQKTAEAEKAQRASRSISGGPGSGSPKRTFKNFRENLAYNIRKK